MDHSYNVYKEAYLALPSEVENTSESKPDLNEDLPRAMLD
jgi:hypothetical protein